MQESLSQASAYDKNKRWCHYEGALLKKLYMELKMKYIAPHCRCEESSIVPIPVEPPICRSNIMMLTDSSGKVKKLNELCACVNLKKSIAGKSLYLEILSLIAVRLTEYKNHHSNYYSYKGTVANGVPVYRIKQRRGSIFLFKDFKNDKDEHFPTLGTPLCSYKERVVMLSCATNLLWYTM